MCTLKICINTVKQFVNICKLRVIGLYMVFTFFIFICMFQNKKLKLFKVYFILCNIYQTNV